MRSRHNQALCRFNSAPCGSMGAELGANRSLIVPRFIASPDTDRNTPSSSLFWGPACSITSNLAQTPRSQTQNKVCSVGTDKGKVSVRRAAYTYAVYGRNLEEL